MSESSNSVRSPFARNTIDQNELIISKLADGSIRFTHKTNYKIPPEIYVQWPKIYSIVLDKVNKQIVSLEFRNIPNLFAINKVLSLFQAEYEYREVPQGETQQVLRIVSNGIQVISYLTNVYLSISAEAVGVLESALSHMTEHMMDKTLPTWKQDISLRMASWSDPSDMDDDLPKHINNVNECELCVTYSADSTDCVELHQPRSEMDLYKEYYIELSHEEKHLEFKKITTDIVTQQVKDLISQFNPEYIKEISYYKKYDNIEKVFDTSDKCSQYLYQKNNMIRPFVEEMQGGIEQKLLRLFTPSVLEQIFSDKNMKHIKVAGTGVGASTSLLLKFLDRRMPILFDIIDVTKVVVSAAYGIKESGIIDDSHKKEIDLHELSKSFSCKVTICNIDSFVSLNHDSQTKLADFYAIYIYTSVTTNPHKYPTESYLASNLLERLSNQSYVERLDIKKELSTMLQKNDGSALSVQEYIGSYNQTTCYIQVLDDLMGQDSIIV